MTHVVKVFGLKSSCGGKKMENWNQHKYRKAEKGDFARTESGICVLRRYKEYQKKWQTETYGLRWRRVYDENESIEYK